MFLIFLKGLDKQRQQLIDKKKLHNQKLYQQEILIEELRQQLDKKDEQHKKELDQQDRQNKIQLIRKELDILVPLLDQRNNLINNFQTMQLSNTIILFGYFDKINQQIDKQINQFKTNCHFIPVTLVPSLMEKISKLESIEERMQRELFHYYFSNIEENKKLINDQLSEIIEDFTKNIH